MHTQVTTEFHPHVAVINGEIKTTSIKVAEHFEKRHDTVLRAIENLECSNDFRFRNFAESSFEGEMPNGGIRTYKMYEITRDGFMFLAMGFTGKEAAKWKEAYINAFNAMAEQLQNPQPLPEPPTITKAQQGMLFNLVADKSDASKKPRAYYWSRFQNHFKLASYKHLPADRFDEGHDYLRSLEGELLPKEEPISNTSLIINLAPLKPGEIMKRWLITQHGDDMVQMWAVKPDTEVKKRDSFIRDLKSDGYLVIKKDDFSIGNFVMEQVPANLLPILIETAGTRLRAISQ